MGGTIVDEPCPTEARLAVYFSCKISSSESLSKHPTLDYEYIGGPFCMDSLHGYFVHGNSYGACYRWKGRRSVLITRTLFNHPFITFYKEERVVGPYDCDSLVNASLDTRTHITIITA
eukprot:3279276-Pleurochrysis_carterae.AAC.1